MFKQGEGAIAMPEKFSIAAVVLTRNSEKKLAACLASLKGWADEIIVVDGNSTDNTKIIAQNSGANVFQHVFLGSFAKERNFGADQAKSGWILQLDCDEVVSSEFKESCSRILPETRFCAFKFMRRNFFLGRFMRYGGWYHWSQHLYKKGLAHYEGRVHEKMIVNGNIGEIKADILHYPFDSITEFVDRQNRYTNLQAQDIIDTEQDLNLKKVKYNLTWKPLKLFKKMYFNKKGYKEGIHGLVFSGLFVFVHFIKWAKVWEKIKE
ncbi:MAG: glycosyltransferase family 2 protein [Candidatus Omnitrophica bacterium]|nr:glycosyltransferase family 2 protein [Candidatus Omnitrophota bacterium]